MSRQLIKSIYFECYRILILKKNMKCEMLILLEKFKSKVITKIVDPLLKKKFEFSNISICGVPNGRKAGNEVLFGILNQAI